MPKKNQFFKKIKIRTNIIKQYFQIRKCDKAIYLADSPEEATVRLLSLRDAIDQKVSLEERLQDFETNHEYDDCLEILKLKQEQHDSEVDNRYNEYFNRHARLGRVRTKNPDY